VRLWPLKKEEIAGRFVTPLRNLQTGAAFKTAFTSEE
jgi:hypothetical protein